MSSTATISDTPAFTRSRIMASSKFSSKRLPRELYVLVQDLMLQRAAGGPDPEQRGELEPIGRKTHDRGPHGSMPSRSIACCQAWKRSRSGSSKRGSVVVATRYTCQALC